MATRFALAALFAATLVPAAFAAEPAAVVSQKGKAFDPGSISIKAGESVRFTNDDTVSHNVHSRHSDANFNVGLQKPGEQSDITFEKAGEFDVRCAIHPSMKMKVKVSGQ